MKIEVEAASHWLSLIQRFLEQFGWLGDSFVLDFYYERHWEKLPRSWQDFLPKLGPNSLARLLDLGGEEDQKGEVRLEGSEIPPLGLMAFRQTVKVLSFRRRFARDQVYEETRFTRGSSCRNFNEQPVANCNFIHATKTVVKCPFCGCLPSACNVIYVTVFPKLKISGNDGKGAGQEDEQDDTLRIVRKEFKNLFGRHVKLKKRHEVEELGQLISTLSSKTSAKHIYDIGSGLGHLSRYLSYACGHTLTCVDREETFGESATKFDKELTSFLEKKKCYDKFPKPPSHVCLNLELNKHETLFQSQPFLFGFTGLHACGNLTSVIIHNYVNSPAAYLVSLGCCYMKLDGLGFPLSSAAKKLKMKFTYEALEVACHANEQYCERLRSGQVRKLMTHSYRAALETILRKRGIRRAGLRGVPRTETLSFKEYADAATRTLDFSIPDCELSTPEIKTYLNDWFKVVLFYSVRLLVANVVETAVLLDRALFIRETDPEAKVHILPIFDPAISPRNLAVICWRGARR